MKKILLFLTLVIIATIILFIFFQEKKEVEKDIKNKPQKINKVIKTTPAIKNIKKEKVQEKKKDINLDPNLTIDRTQRYNEKEVYSKPPSLPDNAGKKNAEDYDLDLNVDVDKEKKEIDGFKINIGTKF